MGRIRCPEKADKTGTRWYSGFDVKSPSYPPFRNLFLQVTKPSEGHSTMKINSSRLIAGLTLSVLCFVGSQNADAQLIRAKLDSGFARTSSIAMSVDEMFGYQKLRGADEDIVGPGYPALWIAEVQFKPVRFIRMEVTDPTTGVTKKELVWYMIYRSIPRDYTELAGDSRADLVTKLTNPNLQPQNDIDEAASYPLQIPRFLLRTDDEGQNEIYQDEVNVQIQKTIFEREFRERAASLKLRNSVEGIVEITGQDSWVSVNDVDPLAQAVYGVAVWRNVNQKTDYFTIQMSGFSNAYKITPEGVVERKVIEQRFGRPGDEFLQDEMEFRVLGNPTWKYAPSGAKVSVPNYDKVLRSAKAAEAQ